MAASVSSTSTKKVISKDDWEKKLNQIKIRKSDLNSLIMNYLVIEGYKDAAEKFSEESGVEPLVDLNVIQDRMDIRNAVQSGQVEKAIEKVNDMNPEILDMNSQLYFHLQQQRLIEMIREGNVTGALRFAQEELAPRGEEHPEFLEELEKTMALLAFDLDQKNPVNALLDHSQRQKTASELNSAILSAQGQERDPKLPNLLRMLIWAQSQLDQKVKYPRINNLATAELDETDNMPM